MAKARSDSRDQSSRPLGGQTSLPTPADGKAIWALAREAGLDENSPYAYVMWCDHFRSTTRVVRDGSGIIGFVMGHRLPAEPSTLFIWQVGVAQRARGMGLASRLLDELWASLSDLEVLEATVTPANAASDRLFRSFARNHQASLETALAYPEGYFPTAHEAEVRYRIGPVTGRAASAAQAPPAPPR